MTWLYQRIGFDESVYDERRPAPAPVQEGALVGAGAPVPEWSPPPYDPDYRLDDGADDVAADHEADLSPKPKPSRRASKRTSRLRLRRPNPNSDTNDVDADVEVSGDATSTDRPVDGAEVPSTTRAETVVD